MRSCSPSACAPAGTSLGGGQSDVSRWRVGIVVAGNLDGVATDAWTEAQVDARRDQPIATLLAVRNTLKMVREAPDLTEEQAWPRNYELALEVFASKDSIERVAAGSHGATLYQEIWH